MVIRADTDELISFLNELVQIDSIAIAKLIEKRAPCNKKLAEHKSAQCVDKKVGLLGILNGYCGIIEEGKRKGSGAIAAQYDDDDKLVGFTRLS
jgi:hypothetical protein